MSSSSVRQVSRVRTEGAAVIVAVVIISFACRGVPRVFV